MLFFQHSKPDMANIYVLYMNIKTSKENQLARCLYQSLTENCVEFSVDTAFCQKFASFMEQCPNTKPPVIHQNEYQPDDYPEIGVQ